MFASATHILTLLAFVAHAVLGCCGHHGHACGYADAGSGAPSAQVKVVSSTAHGACHGKACCGSTARHADDVDAQADQPLPSDNSSSSDRSDNSCPCDDSQNCQGSTCAYVADGYKCVPLPVHALALDTASAHSPMQRMVLQLESHRSAAEASYTRYRTSVALCALLQTWQV